MTERVFAVVGLFRTSKELMAAVERLKERGIGPLMAYTPHEVRDLPEALGLRKSPVAGITLVMGVLGAFTAMGLEIWMNAYDYPLITGGKALKSWQAFIPIMFEMTVLFASFGAWLGALFLLNRLFSLNHPMLFSDAMKSITRDKYGLAVEGDGKPIDTAAARAALEAAGAFSMETVPYLVPRPPAQLRVLLKALALGCGTIALGGILWYYLIKTYPVIPPMVHMEKQPYLAAQRRAPIFPNDDGMRPPAPGAVARGRVPYPFKESSDVDGILQDPLPSTERVLKLGQRVYAEICWKCHGAVGNGVPTLTSAYGGRPADFQGEDFLRAPDARFFNAETAGKGLMPSYGDVLSQDERWAVVRYIRVLQRAQNAKPGDIP